MGKDVCHVLTICLLDICFGKVVVESDEKNTAF